MSSGKSGQILNNRQKKKKKMEVLLPEAGMIEKRKKRGNIDFGRLSPDPGGQKRPTGKRKK
jgi:hypothetical protein